MDALRVFPHSDTVDLQLHPEGQVRLICTFECKVQMFQIPCFVQILIITQRLLSPSGRLQIIMQDGHRMNLWVEIQKVPGGFQSHIKFCFWPFLLTLTAGWWGGRHVWGASMWAPACESPAESCGGECLSGWGKTLKPCAEDKTNFPHKNPVIIASSCREDVQPCCPTETGCSSTQIRQSSGNHSTVSVSGLLHTCQVSATICFN